jgi:alpha-beta hydrolase superfamily lysophospholipase
LYLVKSVLQLLVTAVLGFLIGALSLYVHSVRSGPALEAWHKVDLHEEFRLDRADEIQSFEDYLALEERLFAELDEKIYADSATGPELALARYSAGSNADPRGFEVDWNRTFELPVGSPRGGVLLLHGMSDSPYSLRALGSSLHARGYWVIGLRLPGHGTVPSGLKTVSWEDMAAAVSLAMDRLNAVAGPDSLHLVGYSTGAPLALHHVLQSMKNSELPEAASLVLISPAVGISTAAAGARWIQLLASAPGLEKLAWTQILPEFDPFKYNSFTLNAAEQVHRLTRSISREIESRAAADKIGGFPPTLVFLSTVDATVTVDTVIDNLLARLGTDDHELVLFDINRSGVKSMLLVNDPGPLTISLLNDVTLPFHLTIVGNESRASRSVGYRRKSPFSASVTERSLGLEWPVGAISLSHVALTFPLDDPLYGARPDDFDEALHLGDISFRGERGLLLIPDSWLLRLRHNPFYDFLERRTHAWIEHEGQCENSVC